jgi:hypothetical protein
MTSSERSPTPISKRNVRNIALVGLLLLALITVNSLLSKSGGVKGIGPGQPLPPFAVPTAIGNVNGDANVATKPNQGQAGKRPACSVRGTGILNVCELYERGPLVLALFVDEGGCANVLYEMQQLTGQYPGVRFAAVAIKGGRGELLSLIRAHNLSIPVGFDSDGILASLYRLASCPQVNFISKGGVVQSPALLNTPSLATLRARVGELQASSLVHGSHGTA